MQSISAVLPAFQFSSGLIPSFPPFPISLCSQFSRDPSSKFKQNGFFLNFLQCCWPSDPVALSSHLLLCLHLKFSYPTAFLTSWSIVFLTAVQPLLSDGLFCCLKHLIGGQVYIIRGESLSLLQSEVLSMLNPEPFHSIFMGADNKTRGIIQCSATVIQINLGTV